MCVHACKSACLCAHMSGCVSVHVRVAAGPFVCGFLYAQDGGGWGCCAGFWMRLELCQRMDGVFFLPFHSILLKIPILPQRSRANTGFSVFSLLDGSRYRPGGKKKMELLISLTSPCCRCSARSGRCRGCDECLITRNTSQIAKSLPALNSKASSHLQCCRQAPAPPTCHPTFLFYTPSIDFSTNFEKTMPSPNLFVCSRPVCFSSD